MTIRVDLPQTQFADVLLILGMHRSGTSALARVLNLAGVALGEDLLPPAADNEMGFWEHKQVQFIHDRIYEDLRRDWTHVSPLPDRWWDQPEIARWREQLKEVLEQDFSGQSLWGVKDPRLCSMLPLWIPLLDELKCRPKCVLIFRNPMEVAGSLEKRDNISASRTYLLWLRSVIESERYSRGLPRTLTTFERLLGDWQGQLKRIGSELNVEWPVSQEKIGPAVGDFIRPSSRHHQVADQRFLTDPSVPSQVRRLYSAVLDAAESGRVDDLSTVVDAIATELDESQPLLTQFIATLEAESRVLVIDRNKDAIRLQEQLSAAHASQVSELTVQLKEGLQQLAQSQAALTQLTAGHNEAMAQKNRVLDQIRAEQITVNKQLAKTEAELRQVRTELSNTYRTRDTLGTALNLLWNSPIWSMAKPAWLLARALGKLDRGLNDLVPLSPMRRDDDGNWTGTVMPQFLIPTAPLIGWVRIRAKIKSSVSSRAAIYFDTGSSFHQREHMELSPVAGETLIDRMLPLRTPAHLFRFDPIQANGEFTLESFSMQPMSSLTFNTTAIFGNLKKIITGSGAHRPSIWLGLKLLFTGNIGKFHRQLVSNVESSTAVSEYDLWQKQHEITDLSRDQMRSQIRTWTSPPTISIILPVYNVPEIYLRKCIDSVLRQIYPHWELCIADDASPKPHIKKVLREYAARDPRIKVIYQPRNGGISIASNAALTLAGGEFVALLDHDDEIAEHALFKVAQAIVADPTVDMIYSDEDKMTPTGKRHDPFFKPDWSPEYFLACMYTCHLGTYRTDLIKKVGGWRKEFDSAQDYDLVLRITAAGAKVHHIPDVLYHWRTIPSSTAANTGAKPEAHQRARKALQEYLRLMDRPGTVEMGPGEGHHRVRYAIQGNPKVSIVIPSACREVKVRGRKTWFVLECVASIRALSTYKNLEIIVLDNDDMSQPLAEALAPYEIRKISFTEPFNLARKMNLGGRSATGEHLILLNDDIEVITPDWIEAMLEFSQWPDIGVVGAQLLFPDQTQQHNGVNLLEGNPGHPFYQFPGDHPGYYNSSVVHRNWSAVTGACLMTRKQVYNDVGGFSEEFPLNYNDVDYCLKVRERGMRVVYTPYSKLYHHESVSKAGTDPAELEAFKQAWAQRIPRDPYYNPNLTMQTCDFRIA